MQTFVSKTCEYADMDFLLDQLVSGLPSDEELKGCSVGFLICESSLDSECITERLKAYFSFDIFGLTAFSIVRVDSEEELTATLSIYKCSPGETFAVSLSQQLTYENKIFEIEKCGERLLNLLGTKPELVLGFQPHMSFTTVNDFVDTLSRTLDRAPIFGSVASDNVFGEQSKVYYGGKAYNDRVVAVGFTGVRPVFAVANVQTGVSHKRTLAKRTKGNVIYEAGTGTFLDFMKKSGLRTDYDFRESSITSVYVASPVMVFDNSEGSDGVPVTHNISDIDFETGAVSLAGNVAEGSEIAICMASTDDVIASTNSCFLQIEEKIKDNMAQGQTYGAIFVSSCAARYLMMAGDSGFEAQIIANSPALRELKACGLYAGGEICPTSMAGDYAVNRAHHSSIAVLAF